MHVEDIEYEADGRTMIGHLAYDEAQAGRRPGVLLSHEGNGLDDHVKGVAERLAGLGYVAFALDYHGGGKVLATMEETMARLGELMPDPDRTRRLGLAGLDVLLAQEQVDPDRVAAIGYCFGGAMSLEIGRSGADVKAIVGFHAGLGAGRPEDSRNIKGSVLICLGTDDPFVSAEQRAAFEKEMTDAGVADWSLELYGGIGHSFTNPDVDAVGIPGLAYHQRSDERSWHSMLRLFSETIDA
jgi:dienelactone hydrolase